MILTIPKLAFCPVCGRAPFVEQCEPWPKAYGPPPWAVGCYAMSPDEHFFGVNGDNQLDAIHLWNSEADKISGGDFESLHRPRTSGDQT
jgi:hypothetical protein